MVVKMKFGDQEETWIITYKSSNFNVSIMVIKLLFGPRASGIQPDFIEFAPYPSGK